MASHRKHLIVSGRFPHLPAMSAILISVAFLSLTLAQSAHAAGGKIGLNFWTEDYGGSQSNTWLATNLSVGVVAQTNWNNVRTPFFMGDNLSASNFHTSVGAETPMTMYVDAGWSGYGEARTNGIPSNNTGKLLNGRLVAHYGLNITINMDNVPFEAYDLYVYVSGPPSASEAITLTSDGYTGPATYYLRYGEASSYTSFSRVTSTNPASPTAGANYVRFQNVQDGSLSLYFDAAGDPGGKKRIYGMQFIEVDAPTETGAMILAR